MVIYICTKIHENILDDIKVIVRTRFSVCHAQNFGSDLQGQGKLFIDLNLF